jgi:hypothetical protein
MRVLILVLTAVLAQSVAACSGQASGAVSPPPATVAPAPTSAAPTSAPTTAPTKAPAATPAAPPALLGRWRAEIPPTFALLTIKPYAGYTIDWINTGSGRIEVEGDEITFSGSPNPQCPGSGTYRWSIEGDKLHLEPVGTDPCPFRADWAGNRTYTRFG